MTLRKADCYLEGQLAHKAGLSLDDNPYYIETHWTGRLLPKDAEEWCRGYLDSVTKDNEPRGV